MKKIILSARKLNEYEFVSHKGVWQFRNRLTTKIVASSCYWCNANYYSSLKYMNYIDKYTILFSHTKKLSLQKNSYNSLKLNNDFRAPYYLVLE